VSEGMCAGMPTNIEGPADCGETFLYLVRIMAYEDDDDENERDEPGEWSTEGIPEEAVVLRTNSPVPIEQRRLDDDEELAPGMAIVGTFLGDNLIARSSQPPEWEAAVAAPLFDGGVPLVYAGVANPEKGIEASLFAEIELSRLPREPWQPEPDGTALYLLGKLVRVKADYGGASPEEECLDHFRAVLERGGMSVVDRLLRDL
jgi:hypothetical protein